MNGLCLDGTIQKREEKKRNNAVLGSAVSVGKRNFVYEMR